MKNWGGHFTPELGGHFKLESGGHFKLELGGQYHWNLQLNQINHLKLIDMKSFVLVTFLFFLTFSFGQAKDSIVLKVYLEDAYTNKNIKDGKVTLEGFEIPALMGKYDKKGEFYYFTEIPAGYNTVMAYHKKYNEKGFQDKSTLPSELHLNLYNPLNVAIEFPYPINDNDSFSKKYTNDYFLEDPYKIAVKVGSVNNCKCLDSIIKSNFLNVEIVDVLKQSNKTFFNLNEFKCDKSVVFKRNNLNGYDLRQLDFHIDSNSCKMGENSILFIRKKDGSKFKRFNDLIIKKMRVSGLLINVVSYHRFSYHADIPYKPKYAKKDKIVSKNDMSYFAISDAKKSEVLFYGNYFTIKTIHDDSPIRYVDKTIYELETLQYDDLGLGIYDQYDYFIKKNGKTFDYNF